MSTIRLIVVNTALCLIFSPAVFAQQASPEAPPNVSVVIADKRPVTQSVGFVGRIEAVERVDVRARVTGFLDEVLFKDGEQVKAGAPLYRLEKGPFEAALDQGKAAVLRAEAQLDNATVQRKRAEELLKTNATSVAVRDDRVAAEKTAQGELAAAQASLKSAQINLDYTDITSPIDGRIGRTVATRGNVVGPEAGVLTTIVSSDPMYVVFPVSQREFLRLSEKGKDSQAEKFRIVARFSNGTVYPQPGRIDFIDVKVDRATDTVVVRAVLPNPDGVLVDGQLVQVDVEGDRPTEQVLVPQVALIADQEGVYVFVVEDGKLAIRRLKLGQVVGGSSIVNEGLRGGEMVVVGGAQSLRPGTAVTAVPVAKPIGG